MKCLMRTITNFIQKSIVLSALQKIIIHDYIHFRLLFSSTIFSSFFHLIFNSNKHGLSLVGLFYGKSTIVGYLMPNPLYTYMPNI